MSDVLQRTVVGRRLVVSLAIAAAVSFCAAPEAPTSDEWVGAWTGPTVPESSPYWWTVSGQVSPGELRATLLDREANEARYREAVHAGIDPGSPPEPNTRFVVYVHGSLSPDLMPIWVAYQRLRFRSGPSYLWDPDRRHRELRDGLGGAGLSIEGAEAVVLQLREVEQELESLNREAEPQRQRFHRVMRRAEWILGKSGAWRAAFLGDDVLIARASLSRAEEVSRLRAVWETNYTDQVDLRAIETLQARLAAKDWEQFKEYLLTEMVPGLRYVDVEERVPEAQPFAVLIRVFTAFGLLLGTFVVLVHLRVRRIRM